MNHLKMIAKLIHDLLRSYLGFAVNAYTRDGKRIVRAQHYTWSKREALEWMGCYGLDWNVMLFERTIKGDTRMVCGRIVAA